MEVFKKCLEEGINPQGLAYSTSLSLVVSATVCRFVRKEIDGLSSSSCGNYKAPLMEPTNPLKKTDHFNRLNSVNILE